MKCKVCNSNMVLLFVSWACDVCDAKKNNPSLGEYCYTIVAGSLGSEYYFFKNLDAVERFINRHGTSLDPNYKIIRKSIDQNILKRFRYDDLFEDEVMILNLGSDWEYV